MRGLFRRRFSSLVVAAALGLVLLVAAPASVQAVPECGGIQDTCVCGGANFCICCSDAANGTNHGNCVWYAWHKACCEWGVTLEWCTNAETWDSYATSNGYTLLSTPCVDTIFVCETYTSQCNSGGYGHVGWVNAVYPDGSIDVEEQGCYSWYGVRTRNFNAASASPTMYYIYEPGVTSCAQCDCNPGDVDTAGCGNCGTESRTCGADCQWGGWSACQNEGVCAVGATQSCGSCGGTEQCQATCQWGVCVETCPDGSVPLPDASVPPTDSTTPLPDGTTTTSDSGGPLPDGTTPQYDARVTPPDPGMVTGGCGCQSGSRTSSGSGSGAPAGLVLLLVLSVLMVRRRLR